MSGRLAAAALAATLVFAGPASAAEPRSAAPGQRELTVNDFSVVMVRAKAVPGAAAGARWARARWQRHRDRLERAGADHRLPDPGSREGRGVAADGRTVPAGRGGLRFRDGLRVAAHGEAAHGEADSFGDSASVPEREPVLIVGFDGRGAGVRGVAAAVRRLLGVPARRGDLHAPPPSTGRARRSSTRKASSSAWARSGRRRIGGQTQLPGNICADRPVEAHPRRADRRRAQLAKRGRGWG